MPGKRQSTSARIKQARQSAADATELADKKQQEIDQLRRQLAAVTSKASQTSPTPPQRGTPARRTPASRPGRDQQPDQEEKGDTPDGSHENSDGSENGGDNDGGNDGDVDGDVDGAGGDNTQDDGEGSEDDDVDERDMHIMRQLLEDFREQRLSPQDRKAMMEAAGGQFTELMLQHHTEKSDPPGWLVSLFRPTLSAASAEQVTQVNSTARSNPIQQNDRSPSIFRRNDLPAETQRSPVNPRHLAPEFVSTPRSEDSTHRPSNPVAPSTPPLATFSMPQGTTTPMPQGTPTTTITSGPKFQFRQNDLPKEIVFSGKPGEQDVVEVLTRYRARVKLASVAADNPPESVVDQRAIQFLPFVLRDAAYDSLIQLVEGTLEWRSENRLTALRTAGHSVRPRAPATWEEYCHAFTFLFSAPNRLSVLAREIATIKQSEDQTVDSYSLKVTQARTRLLAEAARSAPSHLSPHEHAWDVFMTATFENGLLPSIRLESIREDPPNTFQEARIRAKKHEANNLRGVTSSQPATVSSVAHPEPPQLQNTVSSNTATIKDLQMELSKLKSAVKQPPNRASSQGSNSKRARTSDKSATTPASNQKGGGEQCPYPGCKYRHTIDKCALKKRDESQGFKRVAN